MRLGRVIGVIAILAVLFSTGAWLFAAERRGTLPDTLRAEHTDTDWPVSEGRAHDIRTQALQRAAIRLTPPAAFALPPLPALTSGDEPLTCRYLADEPSGTTPKFDCVLAGGTVIKVKYGRNAEAHAEVLATRLLRGLGYAADDVTVVPRVRCYGCPRYPFFTMRLLSRVGAAGLLAPHGFDDGYTEFDWVSVERKFEAAAIEAGDVKGFGWWELKYVQAPRADLDAFRLLAIFLAHWDNKGDNQRLACLDPRPSTPDQPCARPVAMMQDVGSTFGPSKLNLVRWGATPIWTDRRACTVSMKGFPWRGASFPDATISEEGRLQLAQQLASITDRDLRQMFIDARGPQYLSGTDDEQDVALWMEAFRSRVAQIERGGPCPPAAPSLAPGDGAGVD